MKTSGGVVRPEWRKAWRIRTRPEIVAVQRSGRRAAGRCVVVCARRVHPEGPNVTNPCASPRFALAVSRKVGNAVVRNRVKRLLREVLRHERPRAGAFDVVVIARSEAALADLATLRGELVSLLGRLGVLR